MSFVLEENYIPYTVGDNLSVLNTPNAINKINGNTLDWNQLAPTPNQFDLNSGATRTYDATTKTATITATTVSHNSIGVYIRLENSLVANHKYLLTCSVKPSKAVYFALTIPGNYWAPQITSTTTFTTISSIGNLASASSAITLYAEANKSGWAIGDSYEIKDIFIIDLTQLFYSGNEPTTTTDPRISWAINYAKTHPEITTSKLLNVEISEINIIGFNQWDEEWEVGTIAWGTGENLSDSTKIRSKNYIEVVPNGNYYFKCGYNKNLYFYDVNKNFISNIFLSYAQFTFEIPPDAQYMRFAIYDTYGTTYNHDICINISDSSKNGIYEPYNKQLLNFPGIILRKASDSSDELNIAGKLTRKIAPLNLSQRILSVIDTLTFRATSKGYELGKDNWGSDVNILLGKAKISGSGNTAIFSNVTVTHNFQSTTSDAVYANKDNFQFSGSWISLPSTYNTKQSYIDFFTNNNVWINFEMKEYEESYVEVLSREFKEELTCNSLTLENVPEDIDKAGMALKEIKGNSKVTSNLFNAPDYAERTVNGITFSAQNQTLILNGTSTAGSWTKIGTQTLPAGTYSIKVFRENCSNCLYGLFNENVLGGSMGFETKTFTINEPTEFNIVIWWSTSGMVFNNAKVRYSIIKGSIIPAEFEPYFEGIKDSKPVKLYSRKAGFNSVPLNKIGAVGFSTLTFAKGSTAFYASVSGNAKNNNVVIEGYTTTNNVQNADLTCSGATDNTLIFIRDDSCADVTALQTKNGGKYIYYEKETAGSTIEQAVLDRFVLGEYPLTLPTLRSAGSVQDTDKKANVGQVADLGSLNWTLAEQGFFYANISDMKYETSNHVVANIFCTKYAASTAANVFGSIGDKIMSTATGAHQIWIRDSSYADAASFKAAMSGVPLNYEKADPTDQPSIQLPEAIVTPEGGSIEVVYDEGYESPSDFTFDLFKTNTNNKIGAGYQIRSDSEIPIDISLKMRLRRK